MVDLENIMLSEMSDKEKYYMISLICGKETNELIYKTEMDLQISKTNLWLPKRKHRGLGGINQKPGMNTHIHYYI